MENQWTAFTMSKVPLPMCFPKYIPQLIIRIIKRIIKIICNKNKKCYKINKFGSNRLYRDHVGFSGVGSVRNLLW